MRKLYVIPMLLIMVSFALSGKQTLSQEDYDPETETTAAERDRIRKEVQDLLKENFSGIKPNPQRQYCAYLWNVYYEKEGIDMKVLTRGMFDQVVVFKCPECSLEKEVVEPFLHSQYQGKTGMDRIKECGFIAAIFKGGRGIEEIIRQVPQ